MLFKRSLSNDGFPIPDIWLTLNSRKRAAVKRRHNTSHILYALMTSFEWQVTLFEGQNFPKLASDHLILCLCDVAGETREIVNSSWKTGPRHSQEPVWNQSLSWLLDSNTLHILKAQNPFVKLLCFSVHQDHINEASLGNENQLGFVLL